MKNEIILTEQLHPYSGRTPSPPPRYQIPCAKMNVVPLKEGEIIHQYYNSYLYSTELFELRLDNPLTISHQLIDDTFFLVFMLQGTTSLMTEHGKLLDEVLPGKCHAAINAKEKYLSHFQANTHILARVTPHIGWLQTLENQFPRFVELIDQHQRGNTIVSKAEKAYIDRNIKRALLDVCQFLPDQFEDPDHEMTYLTKQLFKSYHQAIQQKNYIQTAQTGDKIDMIADYLRTHAFIAGIANSAQLCDRFVITERTLSRGFKKTYNSSIKAYVEDIRLTHARSLLLETTHSIKNIARQCGFKCANYFTRLFRKKFGISPTAYRTGVY